MPSTHFFLTRPSLYLARFSGRLTLADLREGVAICRDSPLFDAAMPQLIDLTAVTAIDVGFDDLRCFLAALERELRHNTDDIAMSILTADDHFFASARQFQLLAEPLTGLTVSVYADPGECLAAFGLPDGTVDAMLARATPKAG